MDIKKSVNFFIFKNLLILFLSFTFSNEVLAYDNDDDEEEGDSPCSRYAFPSTCEKHFSNNIATAHTWMEADDFEHANPESLITKFAGKGLPLNKEISGNLNYRELVDFGEHIGIWKSKDGIHSLPTTKGHIHYSKKGAHIIPAHPKSTFVNL